MIDTSGRFFACVLLLVICGCASLVPRVPSPPDALSTIVFDGPYDPDIPDVYIKQLKTASLLADSAVPYLWIGVGGYFEVRGDEIRSMHFYERAIDAMRQAQDVRGEVSAVTRRAAALCRFGRFPEAQAAIIAAQRMFADDLIKPFLLYLNGCYAWHQGEVRQAGRFFEQALKETDGRPQDDHLLVLVRDIRFHLEMTRLGETFFFPWMKDVMLSKGVWRPASADVDACIRGFQEVLSAGNAVSKTLVGNWIAHEASDVISIRVHNHLGFCQALRGEFHEARVSFDRGLTEAVQTGSLLGELENRFFRALVSSENSDPHEAEKAGAAFRRLVEAYPHEAYSVWVELLAARQAVLQNSDAAALSHLAAAMEDLEASGSMCREDYLKTYFIHAAFVYDAFVEAAFRAGDIRAAWEVADRAKARSLARQAANIDFAKTPAETDLLAKTRRLCRDTAVAHYHLSAIWKDEAFFTRAFDHIRNMKESIRRNVSAIKEENEEMWSMLQPETVSAEEIRHLLDANTTLFSFYVTERAVYVWALNKAHLKMHKAARKREELAHTLTALRRAMARRDKKQTDLLSERLYEWCLKPVIGYVSGDHIGIVAHDVLHYLPFAAMTYKGASLIEGFSLFDLPCAGALKYTLKKQRPQGIKTLVISDRESRLAYAGEEIRAIGRAATQTASLVFPAANKDNFGRESQTCDYLHFALPAVLNQQSPESSGFLAGQPQQIAVSVEDVFRLPFQGSGIVAGAVSADALLPASGEEIALFGRALLYSGAPAAVKSLWRVDTRARVIFMEGLYRNLGKTSVLGDALRAAQNEMREIGYAPCDWAGYTLTGPN